MNADISVEWETNSQLICVSAESTNDPVGYGFYKAIVIGALISIARVFYRLGANSEVKWNTVSFLPLVSAGLLVISQLFWTNLPDYGNAFPYLCWSAGVIFSDIITKLILNQIGRNSDHHLNVLAVAFVGLTFLETVGASRSSEARRQSLMILCVGVTVWHAICAARIAQDLLYRVLLSVVETFIRRGWQIAVHYFGGSEKRSR